MGRCLIRLEVDGREQFLEYCSVMDAPRTFGMTEAELRDYICEEYGRDGSRDLDARIARCRELGTSELEPGYVLDLESTILCNRAGPAESRLNVAGIAEWWCSRRVDPRWPPADVSPGHLWPHEEDGDA